MPHQYIRAASLVCILAGVCVQAEQFQSVLVRGVPHIRQKPDFCGEACVAMALRKYGKNADQDFVFDQAKLDPMQGRGCYTRELVGAAKSVGFDIGQAWYSIKPTEAQAKLDTLFKVIHADLLKGQSSLVCMHYDDKPNTTEHFRLIIGYDATRDEIVYQEPAKDNGDKLRMSRAMLYKLWPLKYERDKWTVVMLRLQPTDRLKGEASQTFTDADYAQHILKLKERLPHDGFRIVLQKPFVVVGDEPLKTVRSRSVGTVKWAVDRIKKDYFKKDPKEILDVWLFKDKESYNKHAKQLFGRTPSTPFGYYSSTNKALVMNISTGGGTLVHEIVHPFMESNFEACPSWFNEGLASLYEQCSDNRGRIWGGTNWRLRGLQEAIAENRVPSFKTLCSTTTYEFYEEDPGTNYSQARYLCYYLQEQGLLKEYFHQFRKNAKADPTGYDTLQAVLETNDMAAFKKRWEAYVGGLRFR